MGRQVVQPVVVGFVVSVSIVVLASVWGDGAMRDEVTVSDEDMEWNQERARPVWVTDYMTHVPVIGVLFDRSEHEREAVARAEADALMDSLSPGVRARYEGALLEREEAEDAAFAKERLRRLRKDRASRE